MKFNIFAVFMVVVSLLTFSVDLIQRDRFREERRKVLRSGGRGGHVRNKRAHHREVSWWQKLRWMSEYNQMGFLMWFNIVFHIAIFVFLIIQTSFYAFLPNSRDSTNQEFINPLLRSAEAWFVFDWMHPYRRAQYYNSALLALMVQYSTIKFITLLRILRNSEINRNQYKRVNVIQMDFGYLSTMRLEARAWFNLMLGLGRHDCRVADSLHTPKQEKLKTMFSGVDQIDRLYYFNLLDFNDCYKQQENLWRLVCPSTTSYPTYSETSWLTWFFRWRLPGHRFILAEPVHRCDPTILCTLAIVNLGGLFIMISLFFSAIIVTILSIILHAGLDLARPLELIVQVLKSPKLYMSIVEAVFCYSMIAVNAADNGVQVFSTFVWGSRAWKIRMMMRRETDWIRMQMLEFREFVLKRQAHVFVHGNHSQYPFPPSTQTTDPFELLLQEFKTQKLDGRTIRKLNENLSYLVDLITHLKREQDDIKAFFTSRLNINMVCGTIASTIGIFEFGKAETVLETCIVCIFIAVALVPMIIALALGATSEASFRRIYRSLEPLMANDLRLVQPRVVSRMRKVYVFLAKPQNRGFTLLGAFSLNFSSLVTLSATIASVFPFLGETRTGQSWGRLATG